MAQAQGTRRDGSAKRGSDIGPTPCHPLGMRSDRTAPEPLARAGWAWPRAILFARLAAVGTTTAISETTELKVATRRHLNLPPPLLNASGSFPLGCTNDGHKRPHITKCSKIDADEHLLLCRCSALDLFLIACEHQRGGGFG